MTNSATESHRTARTPWYKCGSLLGALGLVVGLGLGGYLGGSLLLDLSPKYKTVVHERDEARLKAADVIRVDEREAKLNRREVAMLKRADDLDEQEASLAKREKAVGIKERYIKANSITGDGVFEIGKDVKPGRYKSKGGGNCYYAILNSPDTNDIATNANPGGQSYAQLPDGKYFETSGCEDWTPA